MDDVGDGLHFDTFCLVNILESVEFSSLFMLYDSNLQNERARGSARSSIDRDWSETNFAKSSFANATKENKMKEVRLPIEIYGLFKQYISDFLYRMRSGQTSGLQQTPPIVVNRNQGIRRLYTRNYWATVSDKHLRGAPESGFKFLCPHLSPTNFLSHPPP